MCVMQCVMGSVCVCALCMCVMGSMHVCARSGWGISSAFWSWLFQEASSLLLLM